LLVAALVKYTFGQFLQAKFREKYHKNWNSGFLVPKLLKQYLVKDNGEMMNQAVGKQKTNQFKHQKNLFKETSQLFLLWTVAQTKHDN